MPSFDPRLIALFCLVFIVLGAFSISSGRKRLREAQAHGYTIPWFKQVGILTGIEYILLALTFLTSTSIRAGWLPPSWTPFLTPFYLFMLLFSLVLACIVIYQSFANSRRIRQGAQVASSITAAASTTDDPPEMTAEERALQAQKRRERRQKAAQARRRRAGKA